MKVRFRFVTRKRFAIVAAVAAMVTALLAAVPASSASADPGTGCCIGQLK